MDALTFLSSRVALFSGVAPEQIAPLAAAATVDSVAANQTILFKGTTVDGLYVVCTGSVLVQDKVPGKGMTVLAELGEGEAFGEKSIIEHGTASATVKSGAAGAVVMMIPQEAFRHLLQLDEAFAVRVNTLIKSRQASAAQPA